jgi:phage tail-like protein
MASTELPEMTPLGGDLPVANRFLLEIEGVQIGVFKSVSGLSVTIDTPEIVEGGENGFTHKMPGRMSWPNLVFRSGITDSDALFSWVQKTAGDQFTAAGNKLTRSSGAVTAIGADGSRLRSWAFRDMFPVSWKGPDFDADSTASLEEELEVAHHGFTQSTVPKAPSPK